MKCISHSLGRIVLALLFWMGCALASYSQASSRPASSELLNQIGSRDAVLLSDPNGRIILAQNADRLLVPASILKLLTSLVALDTMGSDYRYRTEFYLDDRGNLTIKGYGDPVLVSEVVADICRDLSKSPALPAVLNHLRLDESYFIRPLTIPGISASSQPYDAPNGALCVNFNTVNFKRSKGRIVSAEPQTPLLPFARARIKGHRATGGRIVLSRVESENTIYAGELFKHFLAEKGIRITGSIQLAAVGKKDRLILTYQSPYSMSQLVAKLLEYSNNFITNQLLITAGILTYGAPGSLDKGVQAARRYAEAVLGAESIRVVEGSGISRENRISANQMLKVLNRFDPHHHLMRRGDKEYYKTGTLRGINTRAGYLVDSQGQRWPYVVMLNTPNKTVLKLMPYLKHLIQ